VPPLARGGGHPSGTAVAGSLVRSTREHRAGRPQELAQGTVDSPLDLAPGGVYRAAAVTCGAGGLLHHRFTLTPAPRRRGGLFSVALSRGSPRVGVTDHLALWSPDLPHRTCARRDRPAGSPVLRIRRWPSVPRARQQDDDLPAVAGQAGAGQGGGGQLRGGTVPSLADTGSLRGDLTTMLRAMMSGLIHAMRTDPELAAVLRSHLVEDHSAALPIIRGPPRAARCRPGPRTRWRPSPTR
jgi:hypothetical protein